MTTDAPLAAFRALVVGRGRGRRQPREMDRGGRRVGALRHRRTPPSLDLLRRVRSSTSFSSPSPTRCSGAWPGNSPPPVRGSPCTLSGSSERRGARRAPPGRDVGGQPAPSVGLRRPGAGAAPESGVRRRRRPGSSCRRCADSPRRSAPRQPRSPPEHRLLYHLCATLRCRRDRDASWRRLPTWRAASACRSNSARAGARWPPGPSPASRRSAWTTGSPDPPPAATSSWSCVNGRPWRPRHQGRWPSPASSLAPRSTGSTRSRQASGTRKTARAARRPRPVRAAGSPDFLTR